MKVVLLLGASSSGKSTLCNALVKEHGWHTHGCDQIGEKLHKELPALLSEKLREQGLIDRLSPYMDEAGIVQLAGTGMLNLVHDNISVQHQFEDPDFPGLKSILNNAGFADQKLDELTHLLHEVGNVFKTLPPANPIGRLLDDIFKLPPDALVIIDEVPPPDGDVKGMLQEYREKLLERANADGRPVDYGVVMAFCPPKPLSERIQQRNETAVLSGDLMNKREGIFPFLQLSQLITAAEADGSIDEARTLSKMQLLMIVLKHLPPNVGEEKDKKAGAHEYRTLMQNFRLSEANNFTISPREDLDTHTVMDLSSGASPSDLAKELIVKTMDIPSLSISVVSQMNT